VRIGTNSSDEFSQILNKKYADIQNNFLNNIKTMTKMVSVKVMLGDSTVTEQSSFDPILIKNFSVYRHIFHSKFEKTHPRS